MKTMLITPIVLLAALANAAELTYPIVDTGQIRCYNNRTEIEYPKAGRHFFGQDAHYNGNQPTYRDNGDGTVTDLVTRLMWTQNPGGKKTFGQAVAGASVCQIGGYDDWRLPTIKELYSLILFSGTDPDPRNLDTSKQKPYIDTQYFKFNYGDPKEGDRIIDSQFATCTKYLSTTMHGNETMFGLNFADGRIKGYPFGRQARMPERGEKTYYVLYVRGNPKYGKNDFKDNGDGTVTDKATGLMWMKFDSGHLKASENKDGKLNWLKALEWAENLEYADYDDWRLPNAKELHSIVDYSRCPDATKSAAIDPVFEVTSITNEGGKKDYPFYWTSTSHCSVFSAEAAVYVAFGRSPGWMQDRRTFRRQLLDVHGAGSQRSDPKAGDASKFPYGRGPQGDVIRIYNYIRCVRSGVARPRTSGPPVEMSYRTQRMRSIRSPMQMGNRMRNQNRSMEQMPERSPSGNDFIRRLDRNGDGKVSQQEFDGPSDHFRQFDRNNDGYLSADEAPQGPPPSRNRRR